MVLIEKKSETKSSHQEGSFEVRCVFLQYLYEKNICHLTLFLPQIMEIIKNSSLMRNIQKKYKMLLNTFPRLLLHFVEGSHGRIC